MSNTPEGHNTVHKEDPVTHLKRVEKRKAQKLAADDITQVKHVNISTLEQQDHLKANHKVSKIFKLFTFAQDAVPESDHYPLINLCKTNIHGIPPIIHIQPLWGKLDGTNFHFSSAITSHIYRKADWLYHMTKSDHVMKGTKYENDWYLYHNILSLMTDADTRNRWATQKC